MNCVNHPATASEFNCRGCGRPFCIDCLQIIDRAPVCRTCSGAESGKIRWHLVTGVVVFLTIAGLIVLFRVLRYVFFARMIAPH